MRFGFGLVYDNYPDVKDESLSWKRWADVLPPFQYDPTLPYFRLVRFAAVPPSL